ncbi:MULTISPECIES: high-potential iron-sulfur protein [Thioalkalivibrio]|uniref:high-potential iron-sulfur protein n=1 Tax=Thioalkalivibrio TaxID=106633 RepID=UPI00038152FF|nr:MULTISPECIES: high-potential iron-sulfur protein [Thioalkalivibrio]
MSDQPNANRRAFLRRASVAVAAIPLASLTTFGVAYAKPKAEDGHAHDYVNDAADAADHDAYEDGAICENCAFWAGEEENGWGGCHHQAFQDVLVNAEGWCDAHVRGG